MTVHEGKKFDSLLCELKPKHCTSKGHLRKGTCICSFCDYCFNFRRVKLTGNFAKFTQRLVSELFSMQKLFRISVFNYLSLLLKKPLFFNFLEGILETAVSIISKHIWHDDRQWHYTTKTTTDHKLSHIGYKVLEYCLRKISIWLHSQPVFREIVIVKCNYKCQNWIFQNHIVAQNLKDLCLWVKRISGKIIVSWFS